MADDSASDLIDSRQDGRHGSSKFRWLRGRLDSQKGFEDGIFALETMTYANLSRNHRNESCSFYVFQITK